MRVTRTALLASLIALAGMAAGCGAQPPEAVRNPTTPDSTAAVWAVDLVRTLPGAQGDYVRSIETNWAGTRKIAQARGAVLSYRALVAPPDSARGWDVMLMTEYADSAAHANREETFQAIFASPEFVAVEPARQSAEMRTFTSSNVRLWELVSSGRR